MNTFTKQKILLTSDSTLEMCDSFYSGKITEAAKAAFLAIKFNQTYNVTVLNQFLYYV